MGSSTAAPARLGGGVAAVGTEEEAEASARLRRQLQPTALEKIDRLLALDDHRPHRAGAQAFLGGPETIERCPYLHDQDGVRVRHTMKPMRAGRRGMLSDDPETRACPHPRNAERKQPRRRIARLSCQHLMHPTGPQNRLFPHCHSLALLICMRHYVLLLFLFNG